MPLYVQGVRDANILLTSSADSGVKNSYEIGTALLFFCWHNNSYFKSSKSISVIGGWGNVRTLIRKNGQVLAKAKEFNILSATRPVKIILEVTKTGVIRIFTDHNKSKPFLEVQDDSPLTDINFISFSGYYRDLDFFYSCSE